MKKRYFLLIIIIILVIFALNIDTALLGKINPNLIRSCKKDSDCIGSLIITDCLNKIHQSRYEYIKRKFIAKDEFYYYCGCHNNICQRYPTISFCEKLEGIWKNYCYISIIFNFAKFVFFSIVTQSIFF